MNGQFPNPPQNNGSIPPPQYQGYYPPPQKYIPPEVAEKKRFKGKMNFMGGALLIYSVILYGVVIAGIIVYEIFLMFTAGSKEAYFEKIDEFEANFSESAVTMLIGVVLGCIFLILFYIRRLPLKEVFAPRRKMKTSSLLMLICVLMGCQFFFAITETVIEFGLNLVGLTAEAAIESSKAGSTTISMLIYAGFIGPLAEELTYRGYVMGSLSKAGGGKVFAILVSAVLFGIMHANPTQSLFAIGVGIVFAYAAIEYGILWSLFLHVLNNFFFGDVLIFIYNRIPEIAANILDYALFIGLFIAAIIILIVKRKYIAEYIRTNRTPARYYGWTFSAVTVIIFIVINALLAVTIISKLE